MMFQETQTKTTTVWRCITTNQTPLPTTKHIGHPMSHDENCKLKSTTCITINFFPFSHIQTLSYLVNLIKTLKSQNSGFHSLCPLSNALAASTRSRIIPTHLSNASWLPSSSASTKPGNVAPAYPVHLPGAKTVCLNHDLPSKPPSYKNACSNRRYLRLILRAKRKRRALCQRPLEAFSSISRAISAASRSNPNVTWRRLWIDCSRSLKRGEDVSVLMVEGLFLVAAR